MSETPAIYPSCSIKDPFPSGRNTEKKVASGETLLLLSSL